MSDRKKPLVSVIIPTFNREKLLLRTLDSLEKQDFGSRRFEVLVVDDGSDNDYSDVVVKEYPFQFKFLKQENQGACAARNLGAQQSEADVLVFVDDDVKLVPESISAMYELIVENERAIVTGNSIHPRDEYYIGTFAYIAQLEKAKFYRDIEVDFKWCWSGLLAVKRWDFLKLGMFKDPTGPFTKWEDVYFGYRATLQGYRIIKSQRAKAEHWDCSQINLKVACESLNQKSRSAVLLFHRYPEMKRHLSFYFYFFPIEWFNDSLPTIFRKSLRSILSVHPVLKFFEFLTKVVGMFNVPLWILRYLYRWTAWGYVYNGFREGIQRYGPVYYSDSMR